MRLRRRDGPPNNAAESERVARQAAEQRIAELEAELRRQRGE